MNLADLQGEVDQLGHLAVGVLEVVELLLLAPRMPREGVEVFVEAREVPFEGVGGLHGRLGYWEVGPAPGVAEGLLALGREGLDEAIADVLGEPAMVVAPQGIDFGQEPQGAAVEIGLAHLLGQVDGLAQVLGSQRAPVVAEVQLAEEEVNPADQVPGAHLLSLV
ncbi:hypothetical protein D3C87_1186360 [compost metagenome]